MADLVVFRHPLLYIVLELLHKVTAFRKPLVFKYLSTTFTRLSNVVDKLFHGDRHDLSQGGKVNKSQITISDDMQG